MRFCWRSEPFFANLLQWNPNQPILEFPTCHRGILHRRRCLLTLVQYKLEKKEERKNTSLANSTTNIRTPNTLSSYALKKVGIKNPPWPIATIVNNVVSPSIVDVEGSPSWWPFPEPRPLRWHRHMRTPVASTSTTSNRRLRTIRSFGNGGKKRFTIFNFVPVLICSRFN